MSHKNTTGQLPPKPDSYFITILKNAAIYAASFAVMNYLFKKIPVLRAITADQTMSEAVGLGVSIGGVLGIIEASGNHREYGHKVENAVLKQALAAKHPESYAQQVTEAKIQLQCDTPLIH